MSDKLEIEYVTIERAHRVKPHQNKKITKARFQLGQWYVNYLMIRIKPGFCKSVKSLREEGKITYLNYKTIIWREKNKI